MDGISSKLHGDYSRNMEAGKAFYKRSLSIDLSPESPAGFLTLL